MMRRIAIVFLATCGMVLAGCGGPGYLQVMGRTAIGVSESGGPLIYIQPCGGDFGQVDRVSVALFDGGNEGIDSAEFVADSPTTEPFVLDPENPPAGWTVKREMSTPIRDGFSIFAVASSESSEVETVQLMLEASRLEGLDREHVLTDMYGDDGGTSIEEATIDDFNRCN